jgi:hypothetical protein
MCPMGLLTIDDGSRDVLKPLLPGVRRRLVNGADDEACAARFADADELLSSGLARSHAIGFAQGTDDATGGHRVIVMDRGLVGGLLLQQLVQGRFSDLRGSRAVVPSARASSASRPGGARGLSRCRSPVLAMPRQQPHNNGLASHAATALAVQPLALAGVHVPRDTADVGLIGLGDRLTHVAVLMHDLRDGGPLKQQGLPVLNRASSNSGV